MKTLRDIPVGSTARVKKLHGEGALKRRIMDMGITKGSEIYVRKVAPLGDPVEVTIRGYELSLRKNDADCIEKEKEKRGKWLWQLKLRWQETRTAEKLPCLML